MKAALRLVGKAVLLAFASSVNRHAGALAYFASLSLAPWIVVASAVSTNLLGASATDEGIRRAIEAIAGPEATPVIQELLLASASRPEGPAATLIALALAVFGASLLLRHARESMDELMAYKGTGSPIRHYLRNQGAAVLLVALFCGLFTGWLVLDSWLALSLSTALSAPIRFGITWLGVLLAFAILYVNGTRAPMRYRYAWAGAAIAALLMAVAKSAVTMYVQLSGIRSVYGAVGTLVVFLLWAYVGAHAFLFGAILSGLLRDRDAEPRQAPSGSSRVSE
ncbi:MAG: YihY/virulence factor BrkB family protein [Fimbriimonadaceae bacterium]|nr:YihY/virulence factor BrkB family protein [Fimbriimonadaceae bacterium]